MWIFEKEALLNGFTAVAGVDEAGRGPLAGPVVSAAVILPPDFTCPGITDSKKLSPRAREFFYQVILDGAAGAATAIATVEEIDSLNILQASLLSMKRAVETLTVQPDHLLIDGKFTIDASIPQQAVVKGDSKSISIAAASILAKVTRDRLMAGFHEHFPEYEFHRHKGYPTKAHRLAIAKWGPCPIHRQSFKGVKEFCPQRNK
ncbi:MAG: ribonuclease HII [Desulfamplus sp.]|nr:ribonuclease HII [Desulfamplus sp.]